MKTVFATVILLCVACLAAHAGLEFSLTSAVQNSARGRELVFSGTLTNTGTTDKLFLNDIACSLSGVSATNLEPKLDGFFANVPGILLPGESYTDSEVFRVMLGASAPAGDYGGSISIIGGGDIFASVPLAAATFSILSPEVTIAASDASASEFGPDAGTFTAARSGGTDIDLPVAFSIGGTAVNGSAYQLSAGGAIIPAGIVNPGVTIPAGASSTAITVTPIPNNVAEGDHTVVLTAAPAYAYNSGTPGTDTVTIHDKPADDWRVVHFGAAANTPPASDTASWAQDGVVNLIKYGLMIDPTFSNIAELPQPTIVDGYLTLSFVPNPAATDLLYIVEGSADLSSWSTTDVERLTLQSPVPPTRQAFRYHRATGANRPGFLRLRIIRSP